MTIRRTYNPKEKQRRLQAIVRSETTLQGLSCVPYRMESTFIDLVLESWFESVCGDLSVEQARKSGKLEREIKKFVNNPKQLIFATEATLHKSAENDETETVENESPATTLNQESFNKPHEIGPKVPGQKEEPKTNTAATNKLLDMF